MRRHRAAGLPARAREAPGPWRDRAPRTEPGAGGSPGPGTDASVPPSSLTIRKLGLLPTVTSSLQGGESSRWQVLCPWGSPGPGGGLGLSRLRGTMLPRMWPWLLPMAPDRGTVCGGGQGSRHSRSLLGPLRALLCALEAAASPASTHPGQQQWLPGRGGCDGRRARPVWPGQPGPGLNGALCGQQSHLSPPPAPLPPLLGTQCGLYPSLAQSSKLGGGGFPVGRPGSWRPSCPA